MRRHQTITMLVCTAAVLVGVAGCGGDEGSETSTDADQTDQFLAVVQADSGTLTGDRDDLQLTLTGVAPQVAAFSDRPVRRAGALSSSTFFDTWTHEYTGDPPNAALALLNGKPNADTVLLTLDRPRPDDTSVRFNAQPVGSGPATLDQFKPSADPSVPTSFSDATLFVDAGGLMQLVAFGGQNVYLTGE